MFPQVKTQFVTQLQEHFSYKNPFDSWLLMKNWNLRKWPTLISNFIILITCSFIIEEIRIILYKRETLEDICNKKHVF